MSENDKKVIQESLETAILMLAPIVPHFCHALWQHLGHEGTVMNASWPQIDESALTERSNTSCTAGKWKIARARWK